MLKLVIKPTFQKTTPKDARWPVCFVASSFSPWKFLDNRRIHETFVSLSFISCLIYEKWIFIISSRGYITCYKKPQNCIWHFTPPKEHQITQCYASIWNLKALPSLKVPVCSSGYAIKLLCWSSFILYVSDLNFIATSPGTTSSCDERFEMSQWMLSTVTAHVYELHTHYQQQERSPRLWNARTLNEFHHAESLNIDSGILITFTIDLRKTWSHGLVRTFRLAHPRARQNLTKSKNPQKRSQFKIYSHVEPQFYSDEFPIISDIIHVSGGDD